MAKRATGFEAVRKIGLGLPGVEEGTMFGAPALKVRGKLLACMASHKSAEPDTLVVRVGFEQREELLKRDPPAYYLKSHYENYPAVLVRLGRISDHALAELLGLALRFANTERPRAKRNRYKGESTK